MATPDQEIVQFALGKLIEESKEQEGILGIFNRAKLQLAADFVASGHTRRASECFTQATNRYCDLTQILRDQERMSGISNDQLSPLEMKYTFYITITFLVDLQNFRDSAPLEVVKLVKQGAENLLSGTTDPRPNLEKRLLLRLERLKQEIWP